MMLGGFFDNASAGWSDRDIDWYEDLLEEQDVDIMAWAMGAQAVPSRWQGAMMTALTKLDFIKVSK